MSKYSLCYINWHVTAEDDAFCSFVEFAVIPHLHNHNSFIHSKIAGNRQL
jgi:hypothetical protein